MVKKFQCRMCGACCRNMRGRTEGKAPLYALWWFSAVPRSEKTVLLFEWEIPVLQERAKQLSVKLKVVPDDMFWDDLRNVPIVLHWNLDHADCPFLSDKNLCLVNEDKPLGCQAYPLLGFGLLRDTNDSKHIVLMDCPNIVPIANLTTGKVTRLRTSTMFRKIFQTYGNVFVGMLRLDAVGLLFSESMKELVKEWIVYPGIIDEKIRKSLMSERPIGLLEHLKIVAPSKAKDMERSIKEIYALNSRILTELIAEDIGKRRL